jgi:hypothetical protein
VTGMDEIFDGATSFRRDLSGWVTGSEAALQQVRESMYTLAWYKEDVGGCQRWKTHLPYRYMSGESQVSVDRGVSPKVAVTFNVDMNYFKDTFDDVYVIGTFNSWTPQLMTSDPGKIWTTTMDLSTGVDHQFKFTWGTDGHTVNIYTQSEDLIDVTEGGITTDGNNTNRLLSNISSPVTKTYRWSDVEGYLVEPVGPGGNLRFRHETNDGVVYDERQWASGSYSVYAHRNFRLVFDEIVTRVKITESSTGKVQFHGSMNAMFKDNSTFNDDIGGWDVTRVTDMTSVFDGATGFRKDLIEWVTGTLGILNQLRTSLNTVDYYKDNAEKLPHRYMNEETSIYGCMQSAATNYDPDATVDDETCLFCDSSSYLWTVYMYSSYGTGWGAVSWSFDFQSQVSLKRRTWSEGKAFSRKIRIVQFCAPASGRFTLNGDSTMGVKVTDQFGTTHLPETYGTIDKTLTIT